MANRLKSKIDNSVAITAITIFAAVLIFIISSVTGLINIFEYGKKPILELHTTSSFIQFNDEEVRFNKLIKYPNVMFTINSDAVERIARAIITYEFLENDTSTQRIKSVYQRIVLSNPSNRNISLHDFTLNIILPKDSVRMKSINYKFVSNDTNALFPTVSLDPGQMSVNDVKFYFFLSNKEASFIEKGRYKVFFTCVDQRRKKLISNELKIRL